MDASGLDLIAKVEGIRPAFDGENALTIGFGAIAVRPLICRCGCNVFTKLGVHLICNECGMDLW